MKRLPVVAHRGLTRLYPENTRASVLGALDAGLDKVEIDIQLSADGVPVLHHDADLKRMSGRAGDLRRQSWARLAKVKLPEPGRLGTWRFAREPLCSLEQLAQALAARRGYTLFVELKEESLRPFGRAAMLSAVAEALRSIHARCVLISFDLKVLELARATTRFPVGPVLRNLKQLKSPAFKALKPEWVFCSQRLLPAQGPLKALFGHSLSCIYEVPDPVLARALLERGIHALETFQPDLLAQGLKRPV